MVQSCRPCSSDNVPLDVLVRPQHDPTAVVSTLTCLSQQAMRLLLLGLMLGLSLPLVGCDPREGRSLQLMNQGVSAYKNNSYGSASKMLKASIEEWPENGDAHDMLGLIYFKKFNQPENALPHFEKATEYVPEKASYWYHKGHCLSELKRFDEAEASLLKVTEKVPKHSDAFYRLAQVSESQGKWTLAAERYGESIRADARKPYAYHKLGDLYFRNEKYKEAARVYKNAVENNPNSAELHNGLGLSYLYLKRNQEALIEFQEALRLKRVYPSAVYNLAMTYIALNDRQKAKGFLEQFMKEAPAGENSARRVAAETRLIEITEAEYKNSNP